jgi:hypothetical protein
MSNFPNSFDDDTTLPVVNDNITQTGGEAINALRDFAFNVEQYLGLGANGTTPSLAARLGVSINPDGTLKASMIATLGLVTLPITQDQIATNAGIPESKLMLDYRTGDLFNYIRDLSRDVNASLGWISTTGIQLEPHLLGAIYRHSMDQIDVSHDLTNFPFLQNKFSLLRNNTQSYDLVSDMNSELLAHQWADGSPFGTISNVTTNDGSTYPSNYAHVGTGVFIDTTRFQTIPQNDQDVQSIFEYIDSSSILLLGTRIQNLYANGISVNSRSSSLLTDGYGQPVVPVTPCIAYLLYPNGASSSPVDDISHGDDMVQFMPAADGYSFDEQFALVKIGDLIRVSYGDGYNIEVAFRIREKKYVPGVNGAASSYYVRIAGKNLFNSTNAVARIDKPLFNDNKYGVLAVAPANNPVSGVQGSVIVGSPRGAQTLGVNFNSNQLDSTHYLLYLALYPNGDPSDGYTILPGIDVTGNQGATPGAYSLDSVVLTANLAFRQAGYNYRFIAFEYQGNFGIMLADSYNNASFSILNMVVTPNGAFDPIATGINFPNNVVGNITNITPDALGFGVMGSNIASPPWMASYGSAAASQYPTKILAPLSRNNFYVNGVEEQRLNLQTGQALDQFGDGYWVGTIQSQTIIAGSSGHVTTVYNIPLDLSTSELKVGKTLVVQSLGAGSLTDFGRFIITNINFENCPVTATQITVYDAVHATGISPSSTAAIGSTVAIYFNSDSVSFDAENSSDIIAALCPFKRLFEVYVDDTADTYTQERARFNALPSSTTVFINSVPLFSSSALSHINIIAVSPKLRGYNYGINKINLQIFSYDITTGLYDGYLCNWNGTTATNAGPLTFGQKGLVTRFYDETNVDYIDVMFNANESVPQISAPTNIDIQLFPTLSLDQEIMLLGTCQYNDSTSQITNLSDEREFGNISEEQFTTSAISFIQASTRELQENGVIRGLAISTTNTSTVSFNGGVVVVNGKILQVNPQVVDIPILLESLPTTVGGSPSTINTVNTITWFVCVNQEAEIELIASTDYFTLGGSASQYTSVNLNHLRLFNVINPNAFTPAPYQIRGTFFNNLVLTQKDVVPVATIVSTVTNTGFVYAVTASIAQDARRFVANGYGGLAEPFTLGVGCNFQTTTSLINWLAQLNNFVSASTQQSNGVSNKVLVKGHNVITSTLDLGVLFNEVYFEGDGTGSFDVYTATGFELFSNIHFHGIQFNYIYDPVVYGDSTYSVSDLINTGNGCVHVGVSNLTRNISINKCGFTWFPSLNGVAGATSNSTAINRYSFINMEVSSPTSGNPPVIAENVDFSKNTFNDNTLPGFTLSNLETSRAAVSMISLGASVNIPGGGAKLVNVTVNGNVCDKDQMIAIAPLSTALTGNIINAAINTTNCSISKNICGVIAAFTQYDIPFDIDMTSDYLGFVADKNNGLNIFANTCKYITSTDARGIDIAQLSPVINVNTGPINVDKNTCSWIKLVLNVVPTAPGVLPCNIRQNNLMAYDTNFRKTYLNGSTTSLTNNAIELVLIGSSLSALPIVDGNNINAGAYDTISPLITAFTYDGGIATFHDTTINGNTIMNLVSTLLSSNPIGIILGTSSVTSGSRITNNKLYRFATTWKAYISLGSGGNHTVVLNSFDQITADGTGNQVIGSTIGSTSRSNIHDNANQNGYKPIALTDGAYFFNPISSGANSPTGPASGSNLYNGSDLFVADVVTIKYSDSFNPTSNNTVVYEFLPSGFSNYAFAKSATFNIPLSELLPIGVKILSIQLGVWLKFNGSAQAGLNISNQANNAVTLSLFTSTDGLDTISGHVITDIANNIFPAPLFTGTDFTNTGGSPLTDTVLVYSTPSSGSNYSVVTPATAQGGTQFLTVVPTTPITVGQGYRINAQIDMNWWISTITGGSNPNLAGDGIIWYLSPLLIKYTW